MSKIYLIKYSIISKKILLKVENFKVPFIYHSSYLLLVQLRIL